MDLLPVIGGLVTGALVVSAAVYVRHTQRRAEATDLMARAEREAERIRLEAEKRARDDQLARLGEIDAKVARVRTEREEDERRLARREADLERKENELENKQARVEQRQETLEESEENLRLQRERVDRLGERAKEELLKIAGMDRAQAVAAALERFESEIQDEIAARVRRAEEQVEAQVERRAEKVIAHAVQRLAIAYVNDTATATIVLPDDELKGRLIGREGRNVRAIEQATGVDLIIDDTPGVVVVSSFDNVRREVARRAIERLVEDGRIHPARIEEIVAATRKDLDDDVRQTARKVLHELDVPRVDARVQFCLGRLKFRTSYGQNQLEHAVEVAYLASAMAGEMGLNPKLALRCGLFHDIGKAVDHTLIGGHPTIGSDLLLRAHERPEVINAAASHHGDVPAESTYAVLAQVADAISAARPGARRDTMDRYIERLENLEKLARGFRGVEQAYALQAGHELRVLVDAGLVDDAKALLLARDIAKKIETDLAYPGEIKVTVLRETRVTEYAR